VIRFLCLLVLAGCARQVEFVPFAASAMPADANFAVHIGAGIADAYG